MTPKEKAKELTEKMINGFQFNIDEYTAIQCALIAVYEILEIEYWQYMESGGKQEQIYWQEVKSEIEKL